ncbi:MAG: hypothetical protein Q8Q73_12585 [Stagnimonas sp.]|nr:hypothetical protein [Stagnimonas sp.]
MIERLLENWLDNASEKSYQGPFLQMLIGEGYALLHNTRHTPIEFGKDVIAHAADGSLIAFQLKGKPGGTMSLNELRDIYPQLMELSTFVVRYPGIEPKCPRPVLVVNGELDEAAQKALDDYNAGALKANPVAVWSRGSLLDMAKRMSFNLWPSELSDMSGLLKTLTADPRASFPIRMVEPLLIEMLGLGNTPMQASKAEFQRRVASSGLLVGLCAQRFVQEENHWAVSQAWTMHFGLVSACAERYGLALSPSIRETFNLSVKLLDQSLKNLADEVATARHLTIPNSLAEGLVYSARLTILRGLLSALWHRGRSDSDTQTSARATSALSKIAGEMEFWGESAAPHILLWLWMLDHTCPGNTPEATRVELLSYILQNNRKGSSTALPPPYFDYEETMRAKIDVLRSQHSKPFGGDTIDGVSFIAYPFFEELVRQNLKVSAKNAWPALTRLTHHQVNVELAWQFPLNRAESAQNLTRVLDLTTTWDAELASAYSNVEPPLPALIANRPDLVALILLLYPHRASPIVLRFLSLRLGKAWLSQRM